MSRVRAPSPALVLDPVPRNRPRLPGDSLSRQGDPGMAPEPLIDWPEPLIELLEFIGVFLAAGAVGFRFAVLRGRLAPAKAGDVAPLGGVAEVAARRAASIGAFGALLIAARIAIALPGLAARNHVSV